jgi:predicted small lipoprotein YifL
LYGAAEFGDIDVIRALRPAPSRWAVILLAGAALALAGCGRKGPLDPPPGASSLSAAEQGDTDEERAASKGSVFDPSYGANAPPKAPKGSKRPFILDPLLNSD